MEPRPPAGIRFFHLLLRVATVLLVIGTVIAVPLLATVATTTRIGDITVPATVEPPYRVQFADGRWVDVTGDDRVSARGDFPRAGAEGRFPGDVPRVHTKVEVDRHDRDTRTVLAVTVAVVFALLWFGLVNVRRIVDTAHRGDPFDARNPRRLQLVAVAVAAVALVGRVAPAVVNETLDAEVPVHVGFGRLNWFAVLTAVLALLALAEVFRRGSSLRELEATTI
jgi:hypothetical protein